MVRRYVTKLVVLCQALFACHGFSRSLQFEVSYSGLFIGTHRGGYLLQCTIMR